MKKTIKVGTVTLTLGTNREVFYRYEGFTKHARVLVSQQPWGDWAAHLVKRDGKGSMVTVSDGFKTPEDAGAALLESARYFVQGLTEVIG
jgi:hypothetical protein